MKSRTRFLIVTGLLILVLGIASYTFSTRNREPTQVFHATINRDCAPWDGVAFTVSIPVKEPNNPESLIYISIWQSPSFKFPVTFAFPDKTGRVGNAIYWSPSGEYEQLSGKVSFSRVEEAQPVGGEFSFTSERGEEFTGKFEAQWGNEIVYCG